MGIKEFFGMRKISEDIFEYDAQVITNKLDTITNTKPNFKGEVESKKIKFPVELGEEHPFDFAITEGLYKNFGFSTGVVDKYVDYIMGPGYWVSSDDEKALAIIETFNQDVEIDTVLRGWIKEALVKNGFLEIGGKKDEPPKGLKILDSKYMYVKRDKKGSVKGFNQYRGGFDKFAKEKIISFEPYQIAHLSFNKIGDMPYGLGIMYPAINTINNLLQNEKDLHMLMNRKANSPYHIKLGGIVGGRYLKPSAAAITKWGGDLSWLTNKHEWVTDALTEIKTVDFGNIGEKFNEVLKYDKEMLMYTFQVPSVLMGTANVNEGIAKVQMDGFERRITSFQAEIEKIVEQKIYKRVLDYNKIDAHVEFNWGRPSNAERYERIDRLANIMKTPTISMSLVKLLEVDLVKTLELDEDEYIKLSGEEDKQKEEERKREQERPQPLIPGQNAKPAPAKRPTRESLTVIEDTNKYKQIHEWLGFNYKEYVKSIESFIDEDTFELIKASTVLEATAGKLTESQVTTFKGILKNGFKKGDSINDMISKVDSKVGLKDLLKMEDGQIVKKDGESVLVRSKETRGALLVRTEVTRTANAGAINHFKEGGVKKIRWVASAGTRTCPICASLDGNVYEIDDHPAIPVHPMCRCMVVPVSELK